MRASLLPLLAASAPLPAQTVAVDVGHFAAEPGATSARGRPELDFNRELALEIESAARDRGLKTLLVGYDVYARKATGGQPTFTTQLDINIP